MSRQRAFSLAPALGFTGSAMDSSILFAGFIATMAGSDFLRPFVIGDGFRLPNADQRSADIAVRTTWPNARSPRFRPDPFARDGVFDHDGASTPRTTASHMLPSVSVNDLGPCEIVFFGAQLLTLHDCCVRFAMVVAFHPATLATKRMLLPTWTGLCTGWITPTSWRTDGIPIPRL